MYQQQNNSFHTAGYRGNQPGHDNYLRSDSQQPSFSSGFGTPVVSQYRGFQKTFQPTGQVQSQYNPNQFNAQATGFQNAQTSGFQNAQSFHLPNYRGNQPNHDNYLRADSQQPSSMGVGVAQQQYQAQNQFQNQFQNAQQSQFTNPQSFHMANYRGNQAGHDNYLRADATQPSGSFAAAGFNVNR